MVPPQCTADSKDLACGLGFLGRLDVPSGGVVLAALSYQAYFTLRMQQETLTVEREYVILCHGLMKRELHKVTTPIRPRQGFGSLASEDGFPAESCFLPCAHLQDPSGGVFTLLLASIRTGRKHQIRIHLTQQGHPVVNDMRYASSHSSNELSNRPCTRAPHAPHARHCLFRYRLSTPWPPRAEPLSATSRVPFAFRERLAGLEPMDPPSARAIQHWTKGGAGRISHMARAGKKPKAKPPVG